MSRTMGEIQAELIGVDARMAIDAGRQQRRPGSGPTGWRRWPGTTPGCVRQQRRNGSGPTLWRPTP